MQKISGAELKDKLDRHVPVHVVEALSPERFEAWHLPGAINVPADRVTELAADELPDRNAEIVVYCSGPACQASVHVARTLESKGYPIERSADVAR